MMELGTDESLTILMVDFSLQRTNLFKRLSSTIVFSLISVSVNICFFSLCEGRMINEYYSFISPNQHESRKTCSHWAPSFWYTFPEEYISKLMSCRESGKAEIDVPIVYSSKAVVNTIYH
ncbi:hypothetical protein CMV_001404 [Castanea mollissima]|uniref:Uncharacterized protein n=1 Tax=Castanea mollissima TaxID=60419 RepID=A0A8J4RZZ5_9ROSI|nr:hypothetical protein CMV_001404 [Castanea mollissima]